MPKIPKFVIDRLPLMPKEPRSPLSPLQGYSLVSTAPTDVEEQDWLIDWQQKTTKQPSQIEIVEDDNNEKLQQIVKHLASSKNPEITISIHGYSVPWKYAQARNEQIYQYISPQITDNQVFVGYRWQAENPGGNQPPRYYQKPRQAGAYEKNYRAKKSTVWNNLGKAILSLPAFLLGLVIFFVQVLGLSILLYKYPPAAASTGKFLLFSLAMLFVYLAAKIMVEVVNSTKAVKFSGEKDEKARSATKGKEDFVYLAVLGISVVFCIVLPLNAVFLAWLLIPYLFTWLILHLTESKNTFQFLPLIMSACLGLLTFAYLQYPWQNLLNLSYFVTSLIILVIAIAITLLRLSNYFRDRYRATHYGVQDLVAFIRVLDSCLYSKYQLMAIRAVYQPLEDKKSQKIIAILDRLEQPDKRVGLSQKVSQTKQELLDELFALGDRDRDSEVAAYIKERLHRVKLNFIGHSMGCFIATNTIRILSDVFDNLAVREMPNAEIGRGFALGRLVLVAPDIPVESISGNVTNYLAASLRRCEEAYVFSNEADVVLRFASTAANFLSFPARERFGGYRLGNVTINSFDDEGKKEYGIVNLERDLKLDRVLELRASEAEIRPILDCDRNNEVANKFTYFDCTDYIDLKLPPQEDDYSKRQKIARNNPKVSSILSFALRKRALSFALLNDYFWLGVAQFAPAWLIRILSILYLPYLIYYPIISLLYKLIDKPMAAKIKPFDKNFMPRQFNTHGDYFKGEFVHHTICQLAFLGFDKHATSYESIDREYQSKQIQVFINQCHKCLLKYTKQSGTHT